MALRRFRLFCEDFEGYVFCPNLVAACAEAKLWALGFVEKWTHHPTWVEVKDSSNACCVSVSVLVSRPTSWGKDGPQKISEWGDTGGFARIKESPAETEDGAFDQMSNAANPSPPDGVLKNPKEGGTPKLKKARAKNRANADCASLSGDEDGKVSGSESGAEDGRKERRGV